MEEELEEMLLTTTSTSTTFLPQEIVMGILLRLPASSLVSSFKLVCKAWCTIIQDPEFIKMHLSLRVAINGDGERRDSSNNNHSLIICKYGKKLFQLYPPFNLQGGIPLPTKKLDFDLDLSISRLVGSCNGLLCLSANDDRNIILLNPCTRKYKISPLQPIQYPEGFSETGDNTFGFGCCYNPTTNIDEYKVVRIVDLVRGNRYLYRDDVYSMSSNSWRTDTKNIRDDDSAIKFSSQQSGVFVNEALHWVAAASLSSLWNTIVSFDIRDEEVRQVPIPLPCEPYFDLTRVVLMNMKGCLSMIRPSHGPFDLEILVMKEYGIKESWTKEFVIKSWDTYPPRPLYGIVMASWISSANVLKGDQILMERTMLTKKGGLSSLERKRNLVLYDINKRKINGDFKMIGVPDESNDPCIDRVEYIGTFVSLKSSIMAGVLL